MHSTQNKVLILNGWLETSSPVGQCHLQICFCIFRLVKCFFSSRRSDCKLYQMTQSVMLYIIFCLQNDIVLVDHWKVNGKHYTKTLEAWLQRTDENTSKVKEIHDGNMLSVFEVKQNNFQLNKST